MNLDPSHCRNRVTTPRSWRAKSGFTLLEVLVALLLLSLTLVALVRLAGLDARASAQLRTGTLAQWVAANVLVETRLKTPMPGLGRSNGEATMGDERWRWTLEVSATDEPRIRRMDVTVSAVDAVGEGVAAYMTGFASTP
ncbi:MAG TPA: type II secretion system minor pseudopilin GspI [Chiayiivirga sp.]|nr:type II secretion system minor pseudopilin GspI [Chiayiivirga sp.]